MTQVHIRKQGGAAIITIPSDVLKTLHLEIGTVLELDVSKQGFTAKPVSKAATKKRKRYKLSELTAGCTPRNINALKEDTKWAHEGKAKGREIS